MRPVLILPLLFLAACGGEKVDENFGTQAAPERNDAAPLQADAVPVRVGELGPNFAACSAAGTVRRSDAPGGEGLQVRSAPFETAAQTGVIPIGSRFFVCTRSHDQRWLGVVYDESGTLAPVCGVVSPIKSRAPYTGPCRSGWVSSAFVKLVAR